MGLAPNNSIRPPAAFLRPNPTIVLAPYRRIYMRLLLRPEVHLVQGLHPPTCSEVTATIPPRIPPHLLSGTLQVPIPGLHMAMGDALPLAATVVTAHELPLSLVQVSSDELATHPAMMLVSTFTCTPSRSDELTGTRTSSPPPLRTFRISERAIFIPPAPYTTELSVQLQFLPLWYGFCAHVV